MGKTNIRLASHVVEGLWEEVTRQGDRFAGKRVRVELLENGDCPGTTEPLPFYATASREERIRALREYAASHRSDSPCLSDEAISRESIYFADE